jgi:hypothetical protein
MAGQIVDASLVSAPKQRNTDGEKKDIKEGRIPEDWKANAAKLRQKDRDARWTLVFGKARLREDGTRHADIAIPVFGYKSHASIDRRHGFIRKWDVTDASRHDGRMLRRGLLDSTNTGPTVRADSAYRSQANESFMERLGFRSQVPPPQAQGKTEAAAYPSRQSQPLKCPRRCRGRLRSPEGAHGPLRPNNRPRPRTSEDRPRQPHLQHPAPGLSRAPRGGASYGFWAGLRMRGIGRTSTPTSSSTTASSLTVTTPSSSERIQNTGRTRCSTA